MVEGSETTQGGPTAEDYRSNEWATLARWFAPI